MIFNQLFSPKYKSTDPEKRIASIENLNKAAEKDKAILHELAFNDGNDKVSLAALYKLDSFALWMKAAETSTSTLIKKHAQQACLAQLENTDAVSDKLFLTFIKESKNKPLLEQLLFTSQRLQAQESLSLDILFSLNNVNHLRRFYQENATISQQTQIINKTDDIKLLSRLRKYTQADSVIKHIDAKLNNIATMLEKPVKLKQQLTMINSRLLALKDIQDYGIFSRQFKQLNDEYNGIVVEMACLDEESRTNFSDKFTQLTITLKQKMQVMEKEHITNQAQAQISDNINTYQAQFLQAQRTLDALIRSITSDEHTAQDNSIDTQFNTIDAKVKAISAELVVISKNLDGIKSKAQTNTQIDQIAHLQDQLVQQKQQLSQVHDMLDYANKAQAIIADLTQCVSALKGDKEPSASTNYSLSMQEVVALKEEINSYKEVFSKLKQEAKDLLITEIKNSFSQALVNANALVKPFAEQYKTLQNKCQTKLNIINKMISQGKYKPAIGMFHQAQKLFNSVSEHAPPRLQKAFEDTSSEIAKLQDWQVYIAQPRKPALIEQAQALASETFEDPYERAHSVKLLRQEWNSLGQLHTPQDEADNKTFNESIEKAFIPCRAFFAELERQREVNYQKAKDLITQAKTLDADALGLSLPSKMAALKTQFSQIGELDKSQKSTLRREFSNALKPLNSAIANAQQQREIEKQALIEQANKVAQQCTQDDQLGNAVENVKSLQQKWKQVGFAGKSRDNELWQTFKQINDEIFMRFHQYKNEKRDAQHAEFASLDKQCSELSLKVKKAKTLADLQFFEGEQSALLQVAKVGDEVSYKKLQPKLRKLEETYEARTQALSKQRETTAMSDLFAFLQAYDAPELPPQHDELLGRYKTWVKGDLPPLPLVNDLSRESLTQVAAILLNVSHAEMPIGDEAARKDLTLQLMAAKLQGDTLIDPEHVLARWVSKGPVTQNDQESLHAMKRLFLN